MFVTGTDTGVGKTVVAASICAALAESGERVAAFKPVVTGLDEPPGEWPHDHELLAGATRAGAGGRGAVPVRPAAVAALRRRAGRRDDRAGPAPRAAAPRARDCSSARGSAGCMVPITPGYLVRDLAVDLGLPVVIAARTGPRHDQPHAADGGGGACRRPDAWPAS